MIKRLPIPKIGPVVSLTDSTQLGNNLLVGKGIIPRPLEAFSGQPILERLWQLGESATIHNTLLGVAHPSGSGYLTSADKTVAVRIYQHGKNILMLYDMTGRKLRGLFYMGDDGTYTGEVSFTAGANGGSPYFNALAVGLDSDARWYGEMSYGELFIQNGVDVPVCVQLARTKAPGKWRKRGTNETPVNATISAIAPESSENVQAFRNNGTTLTFTASTENFPGASGNDKIQVVINVGGYATISSTITGDGVVGIPYVYTITAPTGTTHAQIVSFVNGDTNAVPVLFASTTVGGTAISAWTIGYLADGTGTGTSAGLTSEVVTVYLRYFDSGHNNCGYEGPSSPISNTLVIDAASNKDILVRIPVTQSVVEGGRFATPGSGIRVYKQNGDVDPVWNLMNDTPITASPKETSVIKDGAGDRLWTSDKVQTACSIGAGSDIWGSPSPHGFSSGDEVFLAAAIAPFTAFTKYYVSLIPGNAHFFKLSATLGGSTITYPGAISSYGHTVSRIYSHGWSNGDIIRFTSNPNGLSLATDYIVRDATASTVKIALTRGGAAINLTTTDSLIGIAHVDAVYFVIGSQTEPGDLMSVDQNRPPAHRYASMAGNSVWCAGVPNDESRIYSSKDQAFDEVHPEGVSLTDYDTIAKSFGTASDAVSGLFSDKISLHVHYNDGIVIVDPGNTNTQHEPPIQAGMANGSCCTTGRGNKIMFLANDQNIYSFNGARYGTRAGESLTNNAIAYIRSYVSVDQMERSTYKCNLLHDTKTQMIFFWMPTDTGIIGFALDDTNGGVYGPYYQPCAPTHVCSLEGGRGVYILGDDTGNLFVWNTSTQLNSGRVNDLSSQAAITLHDTSTPLPTSHAGYNASTITVGGVSKKLWRSNESILETGFIDSSILGGGGKPITFRGVEFRSVSGSRGYVEASLIGLDGRTVTVDYGEIGGKDRQRPHRVSMSIRDTAAKIKLKITSGDNLQCIIRDLTLLYE